MRTQSKSPIEVCSDVERVVQVLQKKLRELGDEGFVIRLDLKVSAIRDSTKVLQEISMELNS